MKGADLPTCCPHPATGLHRDYGCFYLSSYYVVVYVYIVDIVQNGMVHLPSYIIERWTVLKGLGTLVPSPAFLVLFVLLLISGHMLCLPVSLMCDPEARPVKATESEHP